MIYRIDVRTMDLARGGQAAVDPVGAGVRHQIAEFGVEVGEIRTSRIFLIETGASREEMGRVTRELLADPIVEEATERRSDEATKGEEEGSRIEIHLKAGVMDPVAASVEMAVRGMGIEVKEVRTGRAFLIAGKVDRKELEGIARKVLANGVIESVHFEAYVPAKFEGGREQGFKLRHAELLGLDEEGLKKLSREGHLFLSLEEMKAIQSYFREQGREPTDVELETLAQTWSEHCVHKTLKSAVEVEVRDEAGKVVGRRRYGNLIKETIFKSTFELTDGLKDKSFCLSVFKDNAGVVVFDEVDAVCFKVETHNHPSAIEPYGGSATGVGGVIRDVLGTGLGARPVANTDVFCVAYPERKGAVSPLPKGVIHPKRVLQQVVAGVRDYGNRMGIPTVNGAVYFDERYVGNPLVFCGCLGVIPRDKVEKETGRGDAIVVMGGRTGRDGIHGATFSSAELTDTHADEFSHAVQIGNAITEKKVADVILQARDRGLFSAVTDCGAGGLSSAIGEMGEKTGAVVELDLVPLKYAGLKYDEIWISEAQERMVLSVPAGKVKELLELAKGEDVEATVIGVFGTAGEELILKYRGTEVGRMGMGFVHGGIPMPTRKAVVVEGKGATKRRSDGATKGFKEELLGALARPNIASKHWIIRQYDHEVGGGSVVKPLVGPMQVGPSDGAVVRPKLDSMRGVAIGCGLCPEVEDPYWMAIGAIDEAIRNVVAVGADPGRVAILDNFCWPSVGDEVTMGTLVRACEACYDAAKAYGIPFVSGKDSLHNQFTNQETGEVIRIPNTLLISAMGVIEDVRKCVTMDLKEVGSRVCLVSAKDVYDLKVLAATHRKMAEAIGEGLVLSCHDVSDGGIAVAAAEMCIASGLGIDVKEMEGAFEETAGRYLVEVKSVDELKRIVGDVAEVRELGVVQGVKKMGEVGIEEMTKAWRGTLDW